MTLFRSKEKSNREYKLDLKTASPLRRDKLAKWLKHLLHRFSVLFDGTTTTIDRHSRTTVVPLSRRINRRISNTLNVESTCETGKPVSEMIRSIEAASPPIAARTCCSNSFSSSSAGW